MSDEALGAAFLDEEDGERMTAELARLYKEHRADVERFAIVTLS
jgi:hypothetical protein